MFALLGCDYYSSTHTPAQRLGPDTFIINSRGAKQSITTGQQVALAEGQKYCRDMNKEFLADSIKVVRYTEVELIFLCLPSGDPALRRPVLRAHPNTVIEVR
jgi:hypothetical protein